MNGGSPEKGGLRKADPGLDYVPLAGKNKATGS